MRPIRQRKTSATACAGLAALMIAASAAAAGPPVYTKDNAPAAAKLEDLPLKASVGQYGITWTFEKPARVGQFVNGDYYVVGEVTVTAIDPKPRFGEEVADDELDSLEKQWLGRKVLARQDVIRSGSMLNPPARQQVAWDSGIKNWFRPKLAARLPIRMKPGDSLVSTISLKVGEVATTPYTGQPRGKHFVRANADNSPVRTAAILTCMAEPQPADAFRPAYCDTKNKVYLTRDLKRHLLKTLPRPKVCCGREGSSMKWHPSHDPPKAENLPKMDKWVRVFQRPWVNTGFFGFEQPMENMPHYEQWIGQAMSMGGLMLMLDYTPAEKEPLLVNMVQVGIDYWGAVKNGHPGWDGHGGHGSGRKFPIVFAGIMLGDEEMASPTKAFPKVNFGEDNQTMYGDCWTGAKVCFAGHSGVHADGSIPRPKWGPYEHMHPSKWKNEGNRMNMQSEGYRRANTSSSWPGQALVMRLLKAEKQWNHDAFFDYVDRWMYEDDKEFRQAIYKRFPNYPSSKFLTSEGDKWYHQGQAWEPFVTDMWFKYRPTIAAPIDRWKRSGGGKDGPMPAPSHPG
ncbi:MAG TPA: hypothetical protein VNA25_07640 [Phycisphaerae bacterium]|nr:hypothetical protein [Phycisphaerae bacterium]